MRSKISKKDIIILLLVQRVAHKGSIDIRTPALLCVDKTVVGFGIALHHTLTNDLGVWHKMR